MPLTALTAIVIAVTQTGVADGQARKSVEQPSRAVHFHIDSSNPQATLKLLSGHYTPQDVERFKQLPGTLALVPKAKSTWKMTITTDDLVKFIDRARQGEKKDVLGYEIVVEKRPEIERLVSRLAASQADIEQHLSTALAPYIPTGSQLNLTFVPILGGLSAGFTLGDAHTMYSGIHYFNGDYLGLRNMLLHEAFHNVQTLVEPERDFTKCLTPQEQRANDVLQTVFREGSAEYVADPGKYGPEAPYLVDELEHLKINEHPWRYRNVEKLIDYIVVSAMDSQNAPDPEVLDVILTDYFWNNPGYYYGYRGTAALVKKYGQQRLAAYLKSGGAAYFKDLLALQKSDGVGNAFSPRFTQIVDQIAEKVAKCPASLATKS